VYVALNTESTLFSATLLFSIQYHSSVSSAIHPYSVFSIQLSHYPTSTIQLDRSIC
jgi:hypothetical protein